MKIFMKRGHEGSRAMSPSAGRGTRGGKAPGTKRRGPVALIAVIGALGLLAAAGRQGRTAPAGPTRSDLEGLRRLVAQLDAQSALEATRQPYLVLDLGARTLQVRLMGMLTREIPLTSARTSGLRPSPRGARPEPQALAGIFTLGEKDSDPRLTPLTPDQVEAGADDENAADVMPPIAPAVYGLRFRQALDIQVQGAVEGSMVHGALASARGFWRRLWGRAGEGGVDPVLRLTLRLDETAAREVYRSLIPGERVLVVAPPGLLLPVAGQEPPKSIRPARARPAPTPQPAAPEGVPFQIPPPVEGMEPALPAEASADEAPAVESPGEGAPATPGPGEEPAVPLPPEGEATPAPPEGDPQQTPPPGGGR